MSTPLTADEEQDAYAAFGLGGASTETSKETPAATTDDDDLDDDKLEVPAKKEAAKPTTVDEDADTDDDLDEEEKAEKARLAKEKEAADDEDIDKALEKSFKKEEKPKVEAKAKEEEKPKHDADKKATPETKDDIAELERQMNQPHVKPKTKELFAQVKQTAERYKEEAVKLKQEVETLKKGATLSPEVEQELNEYREIVRAHYTEQSVEVKSKFDKPIAEIRTSLEKTLKNNLDDSEKTKSVIAKLVNATSISDPLVIKNIKLLEDSNLIEEAEAIKDSIKQISTLTKQRADYIKTEKDGYTERTKKEQEALELEQKTIRENAGKEAGEEIERIKKENAWLKKLDINPNEPEEVRKAKEEKNKQIDAYAKESTEFFSKLAEGKYTGKEIVNMAFRMVEANHYKNELTQANARIDKLKARLGEYKKVGKASAANVTIGKQKTAPKDFENVADAVDSMFD